MNSPPWTSMRRVLTALRHEEPDRVPFFLPLTMHGARALGLTIQDYFSRPENVVEGQLRMRARYAHDLLFGFYYAAAEVQAFGGEAVFFDDGPPNAGEPVIKRVSQIASLQPPVVEAQPALRRVLQTIEALKQSVGDTVPIVGVAVSPFSLPAMQMGLGPYLDLLTGDPEAFWRLMRVNETFCVQWANAQLRAGATAICYFDPIASPTIVERPRYLQTGHVVAKRTLAQIAGPTVTHLASGRSLPILGDLIETGTAALGVSTLEDLAVLKRACGGRMALLGNLNAIEMRRWTPDMARARVREAITRAGRGGGFILSDNHGEIPWQVPEHVLDEVSAAARELGVYPLTEE